jgi:alpha-N-arabinofuranosidase
MLRNPRERWYALRNGALQLEARPVRLGANANPSFLARRQQHMHAQAETALRFRPQRDGDRAGLAAFQNDDFWYFIGLASEGGRPVVTLARRAGPNEPADGLQVASAPLALEDGRPLYLRIVADAGTYRFYYAERPGAWRQLGPGQDGTILSTKTAGGFVGAVFGLHAFSNAG